MKNVPIQTTEPYPQGEFKKPQGKKKWYATTKTLPLTKGIDNLDQNLGSNGRTRASIPL